MPKLIVLSNGQKIPHHCDPNDFIDIYSLGEVEKDEEFLRLTSTKIITTSDDAARCQFRHFPEFMVQFKPQWYQCPEEKLDTIQRLLSNGRESLLISNQEIVDLGQKLCFHFNKKYGFINGSFYTGYALISINVPTRPVKSSRHLPTYRLIIWDSGFDQIKDLLACSSTSELGVSR